MATRICEPGGAGMMFPMGGDFEANLHWFPRGIMYAAGMVYFFLGISIVADIFMSSIEQVTSRRRRRLIDGGRGGFRTEKLWNETVATLTLMALGSSAPEIFLAIIDTVKKRFHFGTLGPSTIVGSAAFNLLVIVAVCILVIPSDEVRVISNLPAFYITAAFSMAAYLWMAFIILGVSKDIVEIWEAALTFLLLPVLVYVSWKVDTGALDGVLTRLGIIDADKEEASSASEAGFFCFEKQDLRIAGSPEKQDVEIDVVLRREGGAPPALVGAARCRFRTEAMRAVPGYDYQETEGIIEFAPGEAWQRIQLHLPPKAWRGSDVDFLLILEDAEGGPGFDPDDDGGDESAILTVVLGAHGPRPGLVQKNVDALFGLDALALGGSQWVEQLRNCRYVNGSAEEQQDASPKDWLMHIIAFPWKALFALLPPTCLGGGWLCFVASLLGIALLTAGVSDLAELFGCVLDVPDIITAITFVALGTSMPDLFASISAAKDDPTADASIVNVTGSNSVNVFLGLGVPWTMAAVFWQVQGRTPEWEQMYPEVAARISGAAFVVEGGDLGFSVIAFCFVCMLALLLLHLRRRWLRAELGGPTVAKHASAGALLVFWLGWVAVVGCQVLRFGRPGADASEAAAAFSAAMALSLLVAAGAAFLIRQNRFTDESADVATTKVCAAGGGVIATVGGGDAAAAAAAGGSAIGAADTRAWKDAKSVKGNSYSARSPGQDFDFVGVGGQQVGLGGTTQRTCSALYCGFIYKIFLGNP